MDSRIICSNTPEKRFEVREILINDKVKEEIETGIGIPLSKLCHVVYIRDANYLHKS